MAVMTVFDGFDAQSAQAILRFSATIALGVSGTCLIVRWHRGALRTALLGVVLAAAATLAPRFMG